MLENAIKNYTQLPNAIADWNVPHDDGKCLCTASAEDHDFAYPYSCAETKCPTFASAEFVAWGTYCYCGCTYEHHTAYNKGPCTNCTVCPHFGAQGTQSAPVSQIKENSTAPQWVLDIVPGSHNNDWRQHVAGGWLYKTVFIDSSISIQDEAVVYGSPVICGDVVIAGKARVFDSAVICKSCFIGGSAKVGKHASVGNNTIIQGSAKIFGTVGPYSTIQGKTYIRIDEVVPKGTYMNETPTAVRTQKAQGVRALLNAGFNVPTNELYRVERLKTDEQLQRLVDKFVRPCPISPRHGFVDSRPIKTLEEARQIVAETKKADKRSEFIVMPFIDASHSGIWTEGLLSIGTKNDGATTGRDSISIPIQGVITPPIGKNYKLLLSNANVTESPYIELLWGKDSITRYVQLRNGPKLPQTVDFIPNKMEVKRVVLAEGDLLEWESKVKGFKPGTVVYHPGGSLASHYAVHAFLSNIPVLISREPKVGETIDQISTKVEPNTKEMQRGFSIGLQHPISFTDAAYIMLAGCHSTTQWLGTNDLLLGVAMGCCYRLLATAGLGEFRHRDKMYGYGTSDSREAVYKEVWDAIVEPTNRKKFEAALKSFDTEICWSGSMGGIKWYILCRWATLIYNALADEDYTSALAALNCGVNSVHNGGWTFNKFISTTEMTKTALNPIYALLQVAPVMYNVTKNDATTLSFIKFETKEIKDVEKYIEDKQIQKNAQAVYNKPCCSNECCGNPDCLDCHSVAASTCSFKYTGAPKHEEPMHIVYNMYCPTSIPKTVCNLHKDHYLISGWSLKPVGQSIIDSHPVYSSLSMPSSYFSPSISGSYTIMPEQYSTDGTVNT